MGEIIDLEYYRRQRKRRPVKMSPPETNPTGTSPAETNPTETNQGANRRVRRRNQTERDRLRPALSAPDVERLDRGSANAAPEPGDKSAD